MDKNFVVGLLVSATLVFQGNAFRAPSHLKHPSRVLLEPESADTPSLEQDGPLVYRYYEENFVFDMYGLTEYLSVPNVEILEEDTMRHVNRRLESSPVDLRVSSTRVLTQDKGERNDIPILSVSMRILGQAMSTDARAVATLSFQDAVLDIFASNPSEFTRSLKEYSDAFDDLLLPKVTALETVRPASDSGNSKLVVAISASVGAAALTALLLCVCLWRQQSGNKNSAAAKDVLKKDDEEEDLAIASTWSSSDESSEKAPVPAAKTPTKVRPFPFQERRAPLSPCLEELVGVDEGRVSQVLLVVVLSIHPCRIKCELMHLRYFLLEQDQDDSSQDEGMFSIKNWTYSSSSSESDDSDGESTQVSLSMQSIDEFEASIRSTPPRKRRMLLDI